MMLQLRKLIQKARMDLISNILRSFCRILIVGLVVIAVYGCSYNNADKIVCQYINKQNYSSADTTFNVDLKQVFNIDFDEIYIFGGYDAPEYVDVFVRDEAKELSSNYILGNENELMVLVKNKKVVKKCKLTHENVVFLEVDTLSRNVIFDEDSLRIYAKHIKKYNFKVIRLTNGKYHLL